ncbi:hypothetical protein [Bacillus sp. sid0103]|uniref:hypothetical protein n=1 Tax=Bacillus sp. sid0103 TaxID=2856337 RepID=UPI00210ED526|nr:hypothetical protein [Bacillus sp. sid0103]
MIINTSPIYSFIADRVCLPCHTSKAAVVGMTRASTLDLAPNNIHDSIVGVHWGLFRKLMPEQVMIAH